MFEEMYRDTYEHEGAIQQGFNTVNHDVVRTVVQTYDSYITDLASEFNCYKALILTPLVHEALCTNTLDTVSDLAVMAYYAAKEAGTEIPFDSKSDGSTGLCQIQAEAAIDGINFAIDNNLISGSHLSKNVWQDMWAVWQSLYSDNEYNIKAAMFKMMFEANESTGVTPSQLRSMNPSQIMGMCMCMGYNGTGDNALIYGRNRMSQYFTIQKWEESFR